MKNRNVAAYRAKFGVPAAQLRKLEAHTRNAAAKVERESAAHLNDIEERVRAAEDLAKAQEDLERKKAKLDHLETRKRRW